MVEDLFESAIRQDINRVLKENGWNSFSDKNLLHMAKKTLIEIIRMLENNWCCSIERHKNTIAYAEDIKANCDLAIEGRDIKIKELEDHLAEEVELHLHAEDYIKSLEQQIEKLLDFVVERTEECDVCPLSETCANSEGVCPYRNKRINLKEWILRHIEVSTVRTETKQFLEYDKMPNCLGTQTTSGN